MTNFQGTFLMVPKIDGYQWYRGLVGTNGSEDWWVTMVPRIGGYQWYRRLVGTNGTEDCWVPIGIPCIRSLLFFYFRSFLHRYLLRIPLSLLCSDGSVWRRGRRRRTSTGRTGRGLPVCCLFLGGKIIPSNELKSDSPMKKIARDFT